MIVSYQASDMGCAMQEMAPQTNEDERKDSLKDTHSVLVQMLEAAPLGTQTAKHHHYRKRLKGVLGTSECPWKKSRIGWRREAEETKDESPEKEPQRRDSSDSSEGGPSDSGCDSDCPESHNITELCKKFDENLSEDVGLLLNTLYSLKKIYKPENLGNN